MLLLIKVAMQEVQKEIFCIILANLEIIKVVLL